MKYKSEVCGKNGVEAKVVAHSKSSVNGKEVVTLNVKYWLCVHAEFLRHRLISHSVKSNRAIPMKTIRKEVLEDPYVPIWFGAAQKGMVANVEMKYKGIAKALWLGARYPACAIHWVLEKFGAHKEFANRLLNPWQFVRETISATEWDNLYALRLDKAAQKDINELTKCIKLAIEQSEPDVLQPGEWHTPYVGKATFTGTPEEAVKCSAARCARSSYDKHDKTNPTIEEDLALYETLLVDSPVHASPAEHQCTPMIMPELDENSLYASPSMWEEGESHLDRQGNFWSGNFKHWIQNRKLLPNEAVWEYNNDSHDNGKGN